MLEADLGVEDEEDMEVGPDEPIVPPQSDKLSMNPSHNPTPPPQLLVGKLWALLLKAKVVRDAAEAEGEEDGARMHTSLLSAIMHPPIY